VVSPRGTRPRTRRPSGTAEGRGGRALIPRPKSTAGAFVELVAIVAFAIGLALLIQAYAVKPFQIPSGSMIPTLEVGQRVLVNRVSYHLGDPSVGDIVVFQPPLGADGPGPTCGAPKEPGQPCPAPVDEKSDTNFIKRIVAGPGDTFSVRNGRAVVNGEVAEEDYTKPCQGVGGGCDLPKEITIPPGHYFMMGDNRGASDDSRFWGPVPEEWIIGKSFATYWPPDRIGLF
jgi:signal peptidase I